MLKHQKHKHSEVTYVGRAISASTATGYGKFHKAELDSFLAEAMK
jgi:2-oxoglutarate dehydrogenase complex dehydrogenase (E1) component-like enzyme